MRAFITPTVVHFGAALFVCLVSIMPGHSERSLGGVLGVGALIGRRLLRQHPRPHFSPFRRRADVGGSPLLCADPLRRLPAPARFRGARTRRASGRRQCPRRDRDHRAHRRRAAQRLGHDGVDDDARTDDRAAGDGRGRLARTAALHIHNGAFCVKCARHDPADSHELPFRRARRQRLRGHVAPGARARRGQSRPGLPRRSRPRRRARQGGRGGRRRLEPISADARPAGTARGGRRSLPAVPGARARSRARGDGDLGRDRGDRRRADGADRARRRGRAVPADVRRLSAAGSPRRRRAEVRHAEAAAVDLRRGRSRRRLLAAHARRPVQQSAQPDRRRLRPRVAGDSRPRLRAPRRDRRLRRGLGARGVRRPQPSAADGDGGHARAHGQDRLGRQDLLADRLEGRLRYGCAGAAARPRQGAPVHHLHHAAQPPGGGRLRLGQGQFLFRRDARRLPAQPRPLRRRPRGARILGPAERRHLFPQRRPRAARLRRRCRLLPRSGRAAWRRGNSGLGLLRRGADPHRARFCFAKRDATLDAALAGSGVASEAPTRERAPSLATGSVAAGLWASAALRRTLRRSRRRPAPARRSSACSRRRRRSISTRCRRSRRRAAIRSHTTPTRARSTSPRNGARAPTTSSSSPARRWRARSPRRAGALDKTRSPHTSPPALAKLAAYDPAGVYALPLGWYATGLVYDADKAATHRRRADLVERAVRAGRSAQDGRLRRCPARRPRRAVRRRLATAGRRSGARDRGAGQERRRPDRPQPQDGARLPRRRRGERAGERRRLHQRRRRRRSGSGDGAQPRGRRRGRHPLRAAQRRRRAGDGGLRHPARRAPRRAGPRPARLPAAPRRLPPQRRRGAAGRPRGRRSGRNAEAPVAARRLRPSRRAAGAGGMGESRFRQSRRIAAVEIGRTNAAVSA